MENKKLDKGTAIKIISAAATNDDGNKPSNVIDGDYATRWSSNLNGAELTLELEALADIAYIGIACYNGDVRSTYVGISVSADGESYERVVEKTETPKRADMTPISLGNTYKAKFVKIHGFGNSSNEWTSITEIKVYAPQPNGSMPVDPNGPRKLTVEDLPEAVQEALGRIEKYYDRVMPWLAHMYDPKTHGFHMAMSGKQDPEMEPAIEMTSWGLSFIRGYSNAVDTMPEKFRLDLIEFFNDRQDPKTGFFIDKQGVTNAREQARNQDSALGALSALGAKPKHPHPRFADTVKVSVDAPLMPDYMASVDAYIKWVEERPWEDGSWHAGDQTQSSQQYIKMLPEDKQAEYTTALFNWLESHQLENGMWSTKINFNSISGIFKVGLIYQYWGKKIPNYDKAIDIIFECYRVDKTSNPFFVRNPLSVLKQMCSYGSETKAKIQKGIIDNIDAVTASFGEFLCPDGVFSASKGKSMYSFGGVVGSHQLYEGDIDATLMMLIARNMIYSIFEVPAPKLEASDFWDWIYGKKPLPEIYKN